MSKIKDSRKVFKTLTKDFKHTGLEEKFQLECLLESPEEFEPA